MDNSKPRVCVIGFGFSGICAARHLKDVATLTWYEASSHACGLWRYSDETDDTVNKSTDLYASLYGHNLSSMYKRLDTNAPKYMMRFKDFPDKVEGDYYNCDQFNEYLNDYIKHHDLEKYVQFNTAVTDVSINDNTQDSQKHWKVSTIKNVGGEQEVDYFDYVLVCNGHNSVPMYPYSNVKDLDQFKGLVQHVHNFRDAYSDEYKGKNILIVGAKWSGMDILYHFLGHKRLDVADFKTITVSQGGFGVLHHSTNFKSFYDEGKVIIK